MEVWKDIPSVPGYSVSNAGRVASRKFGKWRILRSWLTGGGGGYCRVALYAGARKTRRTGLVHLLVAEAFLEPRPTPKHEINHRNRVTTDNRDDNLEWVTSSGNKQHALSGPRPVRGEMVGSAKLTETGVRAIRVRRAAGERISALAAGYGVSETAVSSVLHGKSWAWLDSGYVPAEVTP